MCIVDSVSVYWYQLQLIHPITWKNQLCSYRDGLLVCFRSGNDEGWGDIAPLPGFSQESFSEAQSQATTLAKLLADTPIESLDFGDSNLSPSVRFGFELAQLNLNAAIKNQSETKLPPVACCRLLNRQGHKNPESMTTLHGYQAVKIKVGRQALDEDLEFVHSVCCENPDIDVRIDANRAWTLQSAQAFLDATRHLAFDYIEEPLKDKSQLAAFARASHVPLALDETLREPEAERYCKFADVYVLKPTLSGGMTGTIKRIKQVQAEHIRWIISSSYESGIGMLGLVELAGNVPGEVHGLDTYNLFERDVLIDPLPLNRPKLQFDRHPIKKTDLDLSILSEL
ncbi:MAG: o-succinylbenzoate synthase [Rhodothermaceae bacterium]|nr:o-succinylbenzoate synthase [Rhodothermaceae bacterium]MXZ58860.1 o-succinylbenzoate synthase [Rhodothermaceae bacterium]MYB89984.1 o-succinylbenzoate synthase [Rhodothermaceae bacterium]MYD68452.1 o-succinylbenzoate synthase [Rhodothermaceae bacterium]MYG43725.1 o-succinylbenzoate synthase [Rhodothermaceae bacterium]